MVIFVFISLPGSVPSSGVRTFLMFKFRIHPNLTDSTDTAKGDQTCNVTLFRTEYRSISESTDLGY